MMHLWLRPYTCKASTSRCAHRHIVPNSHAAITVALCSRRGVVQSLHDMFSTLKQHHQQQRQLSVISAHQRYVAQLKEAYSAAVTAVAAANAAVRHKASVEHEAACRAVNKRNEERVSVMVCVGGVWNVG